MTLDIRFRTFHVIGKYGIEIGRVVSATKFIKGNEFATQFAFCSRRDRFNRKLGRKIAQNRLAKKPLYFEYDKYDNSKEKKMSDYIKLIIVLEAKYRPTKIISWMQDVNVDSLK